MRRKTEVGRFAAGWRIQTRVIGALMLRELATRFGRQNIGFLWIMAEPLLFAGLVALVWRFMRGSEEHGISIIAFIATGYIPLTMFRHAVSRAVGVFSANAALVYHRQIKILDFILVRVAIEVIGAMMAYGFIAGVLLCCGLFPWPADFGMLLAGWGLYALFTLGLCLILAPLSEMSAVLEKFIPVTTYIMIPFSGTFNMVAWLTPKMRAEILWAPPVNAMEMMRYGVFGARVTPYFDPWVPIAASLGCLALGLALCRLVRRRMVVE